MKKTLMKRALVASTPILLALCGTSGAQQLWSQSADNTTIVAGSAACLNQPNGSTPNSFWRLYDPVACGVKDDFVVRACTFGVEAYAPSVNVPVTVRVRLHTDPSPGAPGPVSELSLAGRVDVPVPPTDVTDQKFVTATFDPPVHFCAGTQVAVEVAVPEGGHPQNVFFFFIGSNPLGETPVESSFISAPNCGIVDPIPFAAVGFPDVHAVIDLHTGPAPPSDIGSNYCFAMINSTGLPGAISATGSTCASARNVLLTARDLPPDQFGYFIVSRTQDFIPGTEPHGILCMSGNIGRYALPHQIGFTGPSGTFSLQVGDVTVPTLPSGETISAGDTWNWQLWYRDFVHGPSTNFTDGLEIVFD